MRKDFEIAREVHSQLYDGSEVDLESMDKWEEDLTNDVYGIEEKVEDYVKNSSNANNETLDLRKKKVGDKGKTKSTKASTPELLPTSGQASSQEVDGTSPSTSKEHQQQSPPVGSSLAGKTSSFNHWIDALTEFEETKIAPKVGGAQVSIEDALIKLEANRDIPNVILSKFSGDPLDTTDDAERVISGLGSKGTMYPNVLKRYGKRKCDKNESCPYFHHPLLHSDPPPTASVSNITEPTTSSTVGSILDKSSMMPVNRAQFRAPNGRIRQGMVMLVYRI